MLREWDTKRGKWRKAQIMRWIDKGLVAQEFDRQCGGGTKVLERKWVDGEGSFSEAWLGRGGGSHNILVILLMVGET